MSGVTEILGVWVTLGVICICVTNLRGIFSYLEKVINLPLEFLSEKVRQLKLDNDLKEHEVNKFKNNTNQ